MMKLLRRHRDWLMIVIAILAIPFIFYFVQRPDYGAIGSDQFARIYDRNVSVLEAQQSARLLSLAQALGMSDFVGTMTAGAGMKRDDWDYARVIRRLLRSCESCLLFRVIQGSILISSIIWYRTALRRSVLLKSTSNNSCAIRSP